MNARDTRLTTFADADPDPAVPADESATPTPHRHESYRNGRCIAIASDGTRCSADSQMREPVCGPHDRDGQTTIESPAPRLIEAASGKPWSELPIPVKDAVLDRVRALDEERDSR